jgi:hypothetical protein
MSQAIEISHTTRFATKILEKHSQPSKALPANFRKTREQNSEKKTPRVKKMRSFLAEPKTYRIFEKKGRQYIAMWQNNSQI